MRRARATLLFVAAMAAMAAMMLPAATAWACPACAAREGPGLSVFLLIGAMIAVPYAVAAVVLRVVRRLTEDQSQ